MTSLHLALYALFNRLLHDDSTWFPKLRTASSFLCPTIVPEQFRSFLGHRSSKHRFVPDDSWAPDVIAATKKWDEQAALKVALGEFCRAAVLPDGFGNELLERVVDQVFESYFEGESLRAGSYTSADGMCHWYLSESALNKKLLESCGALSSSYETRINTLKNETAYIPLQGLHVFPEEELIPLISDTDVIHLSLVPIAVLRRFLRSRREYAVRGLPHYWVRRSLKPVHDFKTRSSTSINVLETIERTLAAFRVARIGWIAAPIGIATSNLPWMDMRTTVANQNLPLGGFYDFRTDQDSPRRVSHYLMRLDAGKIPSLILDEQADAGFAYLVWAMKQLRFMAEAANASARASHLFIAIDALFGEKNGSEANWNSLPKKLFHHSTLGFEDITGVMGVAYRCRCDLMH